MNGRWLGLPADLWRITAADLVVRTAYQMGKTPLLPLYAASLGASDLVIGTVVSISTMTGLVLKPLFGFLSDRGGRRLWLLIGLAVFTLTPFLYRFVETPEGPDRIALAAWHRDRCFRSGQPGLCGRDGRRPQSRTARHLRHGPQRWIPAGADPSRPAADRHGAGTGLHHHWPRQLRRLPAGAVPDRAAGDPPRELCCRCRACRARHSRKPRLLAGSGPGNRRAHCDLCDQGLSADLRVDRCRLRPDPCRDCFSASRNLPVW